MYIYILYLLQDSKRVGYAILATLVHNTYINLQQELFQDDSPFDDTANSLTENTHR